MKKVKSKKKSQKGGDSNGWFAKSEYSPIFLLIAVIIVGALLGHWMGWFKGEEEEVDEEVKGWVREAAAAWRAMGKPKHWRDVRGV